MLERLRPAGQRVFNSYREATLYPALLKPGLRMAVLPASTREASSLLRGYNIADALNRMGWNAIVLPKQISLNQRRRVLRIFRPDIALLLKSRHPDNSCELLEGIPYLYDLDDADFHDPGMQNRMEADVRNAAGVIAGSRYIANWCRARNPRTTVVWTGSPDNHGTFPPQTERRKVVTWAQSLPFKYRSELAFVTDLLCNLGRSDFTVRFYGCLPEHETAPEVARLRAAGLEVELLPFMEYDAFLRSLGDVVIGLCPLVESTPFSRGKSFGKILAYLSARVPIISSDAADHTLFFRPETGVVSNDPAIWAREICALLDAPDRRAAMALEAYRDFSNRLTTTAAASRVDQFARAILLETRADGAG